MSTHYRLDRESFEALLANAFAVQKSGLDEKSLASFVEIQQFIASDGFDFNDEMRMVAERVIKLSKADGVAIALLQANQLIYCAGVGSATKEIGHRITAVLNVSSQGILRQEILRVEDAAKDRRIESDICRQFGARSLLVLPIYENGALKGILQVLFDDPHSFVEREVRVYRLMASALEDGILRRQRQVEKHQMPGSSAQACNVEGNPDRGPESWDEAVMSSTFPDYVGHDTFQAHCPKNPANDLAMEQSKESQSYLGVAHRRSQPSAAVLEAAAGLPVSWSSISLLLCFCLTSSAAMVLVLTLYISIGNHPISSIGYPTTPELRNNQENTKRRPSPAKQELNRQSRLRNAQTGIPHFKHVRIGPDEVDEIAEDVTIRRFATKSIQPEVQRSVKEVNFGNDVTVRYFGHDATVVFKPTDLRSDRNPKRQQP